MNIKATYKGIQTFLILDPNKEDLAKNSLFQELKLLAQAAIIRIEPERLAIPELGEDVIDWGEKMKARASSLTDVSFYEGVSFEFTDQEEISEWNKLTNITREDLKKLREDGGNITEITT